MSALQVLVIIVISLGFVALLIGVITGGIENIMKSMFENLLN
ncbi:MAG: hypothetical protein ABEK01_03645 [Candidatus Nanohaloarchaea archaeon]